MTAKKLHAPEDWQYRHFTSTGGSRIRYGFSSPKGESKGTVVITGGYGRHIEYYYEKINNWLARGYTVYAMDWDGMGGSDRAYPDKRHRPPIRDFDHQVEIFHEFVTSIVKPAPQKPAFLSSHSKGGNIILRYLHKYENTPGFPFDGAILGTPMLHINTYLLPREIFRRVVNRLDEAGFTHAPLPSISQLMWDFREAVFGTPKRGRDQEREQMHEHYKSITEEYEIGFPTVGWLKQAMISNDMVSDKKFLGAIRTPVLFLTARRDSLVSVSAQRRAAAQMPNARLVMFDDACHGIWYDDDKVQEKLWREIDSFRSEVERRVTSWLVRLNLPQIRFS